jgi:hypothetical protein
MSKFTDPIYEPAPDPQTVARWNADRRREHKVAELEPGFSFRASGRDGCIYYREGDKLLELYWEMSGVDEYDILLSLEGLRAWALPDVEPIEPAKQEEILAALRSWLPANKVRALLQEPPTKT